MGGYREKGRFCLLTGSCWLVVIAVWRTVAVDTIFPGNWDRLLLCLPPLALTLYGAVVCELTGNNGFAAGWSARALFLLGDASYSLYLFHIPVLMMVGELLARYLPGGVITSILLYFLGPAIAIGSAILIHIHVEKPLLRALRKQNHLHRFSML
jgi:peptidoglycan/LPS O-acetylase OafA/YrhL